jgi:hypothetical protein
MITSTSTSTSTSTTSTSNLVHKIYLNIEKIAIELREIYSNALPAYNLGQMIGYHQKNDNILELECCAVHPLCENEDKKSLLLNLDLAYLDLLYKYSAILIKDEFIRGFFESYYRGYNPDQPYEEQYPN